MYKGQGVIVCVHITWSLQALKVLDNVLDHNRQTVPAQTVLFNIRQISQRVGLRKKSGMEGVDSSGTVHRFLEGEDPLFFSTKLYDVKCSPIYFCNVMKFPQTARVYLHPSTAEEDELLLNLSTITINEVTQDQYFVVRTLSDDRDRKKGTPRVDGKDAGSPYFAIPVDADIEVSQQRTELVTFHQVPYAHGRLVITTDDVHTFAVLLCWNNERNNCIVIIIEH